LDQHPADPLRPLLLDVNETARLLRISRAKLYPLLLDGTIESVQIGRRRLVPAVAVDDFVARLRCNESPEGGRP
jgi:excisionase family DNA binding protein